MYMCEHRWYVETATHLVIVRLRGFFLSFFSFDEIMIPISISGH